jgi:hypothetical protein
MRKSSAATGCTAHGPTPAQRYLPRSTAAARMLQRSRPAEPAHIERRIARTPIADNVPGAVRTLATAAPDQVVEVRTILYGVGESAALLRTGDVLTCRARTKDWVILERHGHGELALHRYDAALIQVETLL